MKCPKCNGFGYFNQPNRTKSICKICRGTGIVDSITPPNVHAEQFDYGIKRSD